MIELYKGDLIHSLCPIKISCDKMTKTLTMDQVIVETTAVIVICD